MRQIQLARVGKELVTETTCLRQKELFTNLEREGLKAYELKPDELRRLLVGGHTSIPLDLTLIPLRSTSEQTLKTFRALIINLLHMRVTSRKASSHAAM